MAWAIVLLCLILGGLITLKPSGRKQAAFKQTGERAKRVED